MNLCNIQILIVFKFIYKHLVIAECSKKKSIILRLVERSRVQRNVQLSITQIKVLFISKKQMHTVANWAPIYKRRPAAAAQQGETCIEPPAPAQHCCLHGVPATVQSL